MFGTFIYLNNPALYTNTLRMKNRILLFLLLISSATFAQNCNIGNQTSTGYNNTGDPIYKDYLLGIQLRLDTKSTVQSLNLIGRSTKTTVKMALYKDVKGVPGDLITSTAKDSVRLGVLSLPVLTPAFLDTGFYWIMAIYSTTGSHTHSRTQNGNIVYYKELSFDSEIPSNASDFDFTSFSKTTFTYFIGLDCGNTLSVTPETNASAISCYPNPATDLITVTIQANVIGTEYSVINISGKQCITGQLTSEINVIDINALEAGMYFMILGNKERGIIKFVKQ
jgi:hypothetical protein